MSLVLIMIIIPEDIAIVQSTRNWTQFSVIAKNTELSGVFLPFQLLIYLPIQINPYQVFLEWVICESIYNKRYCNLTKTIWFAMANNFGAYWEVTILWATIPFDIPHKVLTAGRDLIIRKVMKPLLSICTRQNNSAKNRETLEGLSNRIKWLAPA